MMDEPLSNYVRRTGCDETPRDQIAQRIGDLEDDIRDGMLTWEPGTVSTRTLERILMDVLADLWRDCYRRDSAPTQQRNMFREKVMDAIRIATEQHMHVIG